MMALDDDEQKETFLLLPENTVFVKGMSLVLRLLPFLTVGLRTNIRSTNAN